MTYYYNTMNIQFFTDLFFPRICLACRRRIDSGVLCPVCFGGIIVCDAFSCGKCHARLPDAKAICHFDFPYILGAAGSYDDQAVQALIHHLKFRSIKEAAVPLAELMVRFASRTPLDLKKYIVVPLPLSRARLRARGFNQAELIARHFATTLALPLEVGTLVRAKHSKPQSETKSAAERKENVRGSFTVKNPETIAGKNILLIDDVTTSGATFHEAALALKSAGAKKIVAIAAAKA